MSARVPNCRHVGEGAGIDPGAMALGDHSIRRMAEHPGATRSQRVSMDHSSRDLQDTTRHHAKDVHYIEPLKDMQQHGIAFVDAVGLGQIEWRKRARIAGEVVGQDGSLTRKWFLLMVYRICHASRAKLTEHRQYHPFLRTGHAQDKLSCPYTYDRLPRNSPPTSEPTPKSTESSRAPRLNPSDRWASTTTLISTSSCSSTTAKTTPITLHLPQLPQLPHRTADPTQHPLPTLSSPDIFGHVHNAPSPTWPATFQKISAHTLHTYLRTSYARAEPAYLDTEPRAILTYTLVLPTLLSRLGPVHPALVHCHHYTPAPPAVIAAPPEFALRTFTAAQTHQLASLHAPLAPAAPDALVHDTGTLIQRPRAAHTAEIPGHVRCRGARGGGVCGV